MIKYTKPGPGPGSLEALSGRIVLDGKYAREILVLFYVDEYEHGFANERELKDVVGWEAKRYESLLREHPHLDLDEYLYDHKQHLDTQFANGRTRRNYFYKDGTEHSNIGRVIYQTDVPDDSIGWRPDARQFFEQLGDPRHALNDLKRMAEQEYLMQNMVKGALWEAAEIADRYRMGIAVRGTGLLAHMGIESGDPTKAQEFKNKTSKEADLWLCDELAFADLGAVVHYDPRIGWSSRKAALESEGRNAPLFAAPATEADWFRKMVHMRTVRTRQLDPISAKLKIDLYDEKKLAAVKDLFFSRAKEYMEEDYDYRKGHYAAYTVLDGPRIRLKVRPDKNMVGDHDLFMFTTEEYGVPAAIANIANIQRTMQLAPTFQAQHGGIWYWQPTTDFNRGIKTKIMGAHGPDGDEPLVYIRPGFQVVAAYFIAATGRLQSVWDDPAWTKWMATTYSGKQYLSAPPLPPVVAHEDPLAETRRRVRARRARDEMARGVMRANLKDNSSLA
ncbi:hypothetical protein [Ramlibacter albus]|uniref:Uncharacterized protein n=1 Tax=Ramlibacter albus TaxID=2079448 RepID=A0A923S481_9BURK|nr:hypothetical protein [Ramlibacter albus]MBC5767314.1 hypothetical protein [Ramlibacter albus]